MTALDDGPDASMGLATSANQHATSKQMPAWQRWYARRLIALDSLAVATAVVLAQRLRFGAIPGAELNYRFVDYTVVSAMTATMWLTALAVNRSRSPRVIGAGPEEYRRVLLATLSVFGATAILSMLFKLEIARGYLIIALPVGIALLVGGRWLARRFVNRARMKYGRCITRVVVVGSAPAVCDLTRSLAREPRSGYEVAGACIPDGSLRGTIEVPGVGVLPTFGNESNVVGAVAGYGQPRCRRHRD
ncbi:hypothetical protein MLIT_32050 [Mycolicibacterium litorale]|uniref:Sugar transferase n=1 Tax=Mycolicibacterium litorale TaxID=758802 RepID=A0AAD1ITU8_9MYCO|nr:hypothetical protein MLIT_32050 [Mycolicibacterium litorale]